MIFFSLPCAIVMLSTLCGVMAPAIDTGDIRAIYDGTPLRVQLPGATAVLDTAAASMIDGTLARPCSAEDPCWVVAQEPVDVADSYGKPLQSVRSRDLLINRARGKGMTERGAPNLILAPLLAVLWVVDPDSFFFAYVKPDSKLLTPVLPPATNDLTVSRIPGLAIGKLKKAVEKGDVPSDQMLPEKVKPPELYLVLRCNGLRVLLCDANDADGPMAHSLREHLGDAHASTRAWTHVPRAKRASARRALAWRVAARPRRVRASYAYINITYYRACT